MRIGAYILLGLLFLPLVTFAAGLVPDCGLGAGQYMCQACHMAALVHNILVFMVGLAVAAATLMFAYAGFLYVTAAANHGNIDSAKRVFGQVLVGLILVLVAWLIVDLVLRVFTGQSLQVLTKFECVRSELVAGSFVFPETPLEEVVVTTPPTGSCTTNPVTHEGAMSALTAACIHVTSSKGDGAANVNGICAGWGCTNLSGVCSGSVAKIIEINQELIKAGCGPVGGGSCRSPIEIRGGTERAVHIKGGTHEVGLAFDVTEDDCVGRWIQQNGRKYGMRQFCTTPEEYAKGFGFGGCEGKEPSSQPHFHFGF